MEIKIGVRQIGRELTVETDQTAEQLEQALREALRADDGVLVVHADKGRRLLLPAGQIGYLDPVNQDRMDSILKTHFFDRIFGII